jgi:uncharacterized protein YkwD
MSHSTISLGNPLCKVAIVVLAMAGSSCAIATNDGPCADGTIPAAGETCDLAAQNPSTRSIEDQILALVNGERENAGSRPLSFSCELASAARDHNGRMMRDGFFDHRGGGERCLLDRVLMAGMNPDSVGENLFKTNGPSSGVARQCVAMWMQSDGHRRNLLSRDFDTTGISVSYSRGECYVTEDFARIGTALHVTRKRSAHRRRVAARHSQTRHSSRAIASRRNMHHEENRVVPQLAMGDGR